MNDEDQSIFNLTGHNGVEFFLWDQTVLIEVSSVDQLLELFLTDILTQLLRYSSQVFNWNVSSFLVIVKIKNLGDAIASIFVIDSLSHKVEPLSEVDSSISISIKISDHLEDWAVFGLKSQRSHGSFEFLDINCSSLIWVKKIEGCFDSNDFLFADSILHIGFRIEFRLGGSRRLGILGRCRYTFSRCRSLFSRWGRSLFSRWGRGLFAWGSGSLSRWIQTLGGETLAGVGVSLGGELLGWLAKELLFVEN